MKPTTVLGVMLRRAARPIVPYRETWVADTAAGKVRISKSADGWWHPEIEGHRFSVSHSDGVVRTYRGWVCPRGANDPYRGMRSAARALDTWLQRLRRHR